MKTLLLAMSSLLSAGPAFAVDNTRGCRLVSYLTGERTISSTAGELGDSEDGSPIVLRGYVLTLNCALSAPETFFFYGSDDSKRTAALVKGLPNGSSITVQVRTLPAGMEERDLVTLIRAASAKGTANGLAGVPLDPSTKIR